MTTYTFTISHGDHGGRSPDRDELPDSWHCIDCGFDTAPGCFNRAEMAKAIACGGKYKDIPQSIDNRSEVYEVRDALWKKAGMEPFGGCLCIGCLEKRLGRRLRPKDFVRDDLLNIIPAGTKRLLNRRGC